MITVQADANKFAHNEVMSDSVEIIDGNDNAFAYLADALAAVVMIVVHAEAKYGPVITDAMLTSLEAKTLRNKINEKRGEMPNEDQTADCPDC